MIVQARRKPILYEPPPGYYDLPFTWAYDASALTIGQNYPNQYIYMLGGYGDFICRRMVGLNRLLSTATGQFQIKDGQNNYLQSDPVYSVNVYDELKVPEIKYPELGAIRFDLYNFNPSGTTAPQSAQLAFQGVRRMKGALTRPDYKYKEKSFIYQVTGTLTQTWPAAPVTVSQIINDYDFDLYQVIVLAGGAATLQLTEQPYTWTAQQVGPAGDSITIQVTGVGTPNLPLAITVVGTAITIQLSTDGGGAVTATNAQVYNLWNTTPAAIALAVLNIATSAFPLLWSTGNCGPSNLAGGKISPIVTPISQLWIYDQNKVQISNIPINDVFVNGGQGSYYVNGAIIPRLYYRQQTRIQIDIYSLLPSLSVLPQSIIIYLVGKQLYPC